MEEGNMVPSPKRRKLSKGILQRIFSPENTSALRDPGPTWPHKVETIKHTPTALTARPTRVHVEVKERPYPLPFIAPVQLQPRQFDTLSAGVSASVGIDTSDSSATTSTSTVASSVASSTTSSTSSPPPSSTASSASESTSSASASSSSSSASPSSTSSGTAPSTESSTIRSSGTESSTSSNGSSTTSASSDISASVESTSALSSATSSRNTSSSSSSISDQGAVSIAAASATSSHSNSTLSTTRSSSESSSTTGLGVILLSTNSDGEVFTLTRSGSSTSTLSSTSSTSPTRTPSSSSHTVASSSTSDGRTTTNSHGSSIVVYQTVSASSNGEGDIQQITYYSTQIITPDVAGASAVGTGSLSSSTSNPTTANGGGGGDDNSPPASTVAGGVVGGVAGLAFIVLLAMLLLRWYRRKGTHQALTGVGSASAIGSMDDDQQPGPSGPGMAERAGLMPIMNAVPGMFRHQNRSTEASTSEPSERGFTRVSGRKLPSAFSEGMTGPPPHMPIPMSYSEAGSVSTTNFGENDPFVDHPRSAPDARYGAVGSAGMVPMSSQNGEQLQMSPGPARKPTVHHGGPYNVTPSSSTMAASPSRSFVPGGDSFNSPPTSTTAFLRSETPASLVDSRGSRFMEEV